MGTSFGNLKRYGTFDTVLVNKEWLIEQYVAQCKSLCQMMEETGLNRERIRRALIRFGITRRTKKESNDISTANGRNFHPRGADNPRWAGPKRVNNQGYVIIWKPEHPRATKAGYVREHLLIWEEANSRALPKGWHIHHLNGIKDDNRLGNLVALPETSHKRILASKAQRIRELEAKIRELQSARATNQLLLIAQ